MFVTALALVLGDFPAAVVDYAADPRTGVITKFPMGLPSVGQIKQFLDDALARQERVNRYAALPKPGRAQVFDKPPISEPNLFVPETSNRYQAMVRRAEGERDRAHFGSKTCADGVARSGVFVPLDWWEEPSKDWALQDAAKRFYEHACKESGIDPARGYSDALVKILSQQNEAAE